MACDPPHQPLLGVDEALERLLNAARPVDEIEQCALHHALGRVLASALVAPHNIPPTDNSAMDGYAINHRDLDASAQTTLPISQRIIAGAVPQPLAPKSAARIFTGAPIPDGADTVIPQEQCIAEDEHVAINGAIPKGKHIRRAGEDIANGSVYMQAGRRLQPQAMGLIAANGVATVSIFRKLKVALLSTGNELMMPGEQIQAGRIYNSNHFTLSGLLQALGCEIIAPGIVRDELAATSNALSHAAREADIIISSGGVSVGEEDHVKAAIELLGRLELWKLNIKPGKPLAFGQIAETPFFGLPGNPVSLFVTFCLFARPFILRMQGMTEVLPQSLKAHAQFTRTKKGSRQEYVRSRISTTESGMEVTPFDKQGSGVLSSTVWANSLTVIPPNSTIKPGDLVEVIPFSELVS